MKSCALCGKDVDVGRAIARKETCRHCGADLHICLNCRFYSKTSHNQCIETKSEQQRSRDKANFCDYFQYKDGKGASTEQIRAEAKQKLDDLFRK